MLLEMAKASDRKGMPYSGYCAPFYQQAALNVLFHCNKSFIPGHASAALRAWFALTAPISSDRLVMMLSPVFYSR
jgi:hypothetical protein